MAELKTPGANSLAGKTLFITGASRGIGLAIAKRAAADGANIAIAAKTDQPHPKLPGTIHTAAAEVEAAGGRALPLVCDIRDENAVEAAVRRTAEHFGGIDICVNNASAISLTKTPDTPAKRYDLMHQINGRGTFLVSQACIPYLKQADNPHVLNLSPPLDLQPKWFAPHVAYSMAKYNMSLCVLGMAEEFRDDGIAFNALWPRTGIATAAIDLIGGKELREHCRTPEIVSDAAHVILTQPAREFTGQFCMDDRVLADAGVTDFSVYAVDPSQELWPDFFVPDDLPPPPGSMGNTS
ncbi:SDR family oxidoreductase [Salinisphaera hydrothermalis]|uniref:Short chain dehydrogenase n=1 Tax=Salinisphaera hydrothermalis (strain C41B8) TaxID=1304275 RepID=A0A084ILA4_SALHC|nr:NAD(P)-dependent oxidoreductase [Salinisphaera hydrothermalis]KEZ77488.1 short chain dehydrogenase [Salinisphaera hydrothermalis C41B8]